MSTASSGEGRLSDLLLLWEENWEEGCDVPAEELCAGCPELIEELKRRIGELKAINVPFGLDEAVASGIPSISTTAGPGPAPDPGPDPSTSRGSASCASHFHDLRFHAKGGLGVVFKARNQEFQRQVALKFIKEERSRHPETLRRFLAEAEITGRLEHPGIVPVYGIGKDGDGHPCYAMRFIRGKPLDAAIREFHEADKPGFDPASRDKSFRDLLGQIQGADKTGEGQDLRDRGFRELLNRFKSVCQTIAYAHSKGVLHRDLKPGNVMLGKYGETLVVDWGLAKPYRRGEPTRTEGEETMPLFPDEDSDAQPPSDPKGTPAYMSPEQAEGHGLGPASDIYGLGAVLYAILTGHPPFRGSFGEIRDQKRRGEFLPPRQRKNGTPRALEAICLKAMALRPEDRYATAAAPAEDIENWLADRPVTAYPEPWLTRLSRWARRHREPVFVGVAALLVITLVAIGAVFLINKARLSEQAEHGRAQKEWLRAEAEHRRAEAGYQAALAGSVETSALADELKPIAGTQSTTVERILNLAANRIKAQQATFGKLPALEEVEARNLISFVAVYIELGSTDKARAAAEQAQAIFERLLHRGPSNVVWQGGLAASQEKLGIALAWQGRLTESMNALRAALAARERLAQQVPENPQWQSDLASSYHWMGFAQKLQFNTSAREAAHRKALALRERLVRRDPQNRKWQGMLAETLTSIANVLYDQGNTAESVTSHRKAIQIYTDLTRLDPTNAEWQGRLVDADISLALVYHNAQNKSLEARESINGALAIAGRFAQLDPGNAEWESRVLKCRLHLADILKGEDAVAGLKEQVGTLQDLLSIVEPRARKDPHNAFWQRDVASLRQYAGLCSAGLARQGVTPDQSYAKALEFLRSALAVHEGPLKPEPIDYAAALNRSTIHNSFAMVLGEMKDQTGSQTARLKSVRIMEDFFRHQAEQDPENITWQIELGEKIKLLGAVLFLQGDFPAAGDAFRSSLKIFEWLAEREPNVVKWQHELALGHENIGKVLHRQLQLAESLTEFRKGLAIRERLAELEPGNAQWLRELASAYMDLRGRCRMVDDRDEAVQAYEKSLDTLDRLDALDPDERRRDPFAPETHWSILLQVHEQLGHREQLSWSRDSLNGFELLLQTVPDIDRAGEFVVSCIQLRRELDVSKTQEANEARRVLHRGLTVLRQLRDAKQLHRVQERLIGQFEAALKDLPADPNRKPLEAPLQQVLDDMDYLQLAALLVEQERSRDLIAILGQETKDAIEMTWLSVRLRAIALEPKLVAEIVQTARAMVREDPASLGPEVRKFIATLARHVGDLDAATEFDQHILETPPDDTLAMQIYIRLQRAGRLAEAARAIKESTEKDPILLGQVYFDQRHFTQAQDQFRKILDQPGLTPEARSEARIYLASIDDELGQQEDAEAEIRKVLADDPDNPMANALLAYLDTDRGKDLEQAEARIRKVLKAQPDDPHFLSVLGWLLAKRGHEDQGLEILEKVSAHEELAHSPVFFEHLGDVYLQVNRRDEARATWQKALGLFPATTEPTDRRKREIQAKLKALESSAR